ncbi:hypothetical protein [Arthrobacter sp. B3I4]|uniref:hypothetical protein n=1 Tax=Arthrobacter sp. B3I4 TaxID=3042267 RepID=UPI0027D859B3|nr:hypothetical protein [Arthrobacter sp. B3I4]
MTRAERCPISAPAPIAAAKAERSDVGAGLGTAVGARLGAAVAVGIAVAVADGAGWVTAVSAVIPVLAGVVAGTGAGVDSVVVAPGSGAGDASADSGFARLTLVTSVETARTNADLALMFLVRESGIRFIMCSGTLERFVSAA